MFSRKSSATEVDQPNQIRPDSVVRYADLSHKLSLRTKLFYSFGHVYNDLCASIWFSYTLLFFKLSFDDTTAGLLLLLGQVADAISTPLVGYGSDKNLSIFGNYGRRKVWHLIGSVVTCVFPLIFSSCVLCSDSDLWGKFIYYSVLIALFQFGWAAVQVAHLSLITDLSDVSSERVELNAYRQAATVASSICVYTITLLFLGVEDSTISQSDSVVFMKVVHLITVIGIVFSVLFHVFVKEPPVRQEWELKQIEQDIEQSANQQARARCDSHYSANLTEHTPSACTDRKKSNLLEQGLDSKTISAESDEQTKRKRGRNGHIWSDWLRSVSFWKICVIYMMSRLYVNVTQVYTPLYLQETLRLAKRNIAIVPFITYTAGFACSMLIKSKKINSKIIMCMGCFFSFISCVWIWYCYLQISIWEVFVMAAVFGIGGTFMLIGSLSLTADLIDDNKISGAFVYGLMSLFDKLINGAVIALVQYLKPASSAILPSSVQLAGTNMTEHATLWNATLSGVQLQQQPDTKTVISLSAVQPSLSTDPTVFYLYVLVFVSGAAVIVTFFALILIMRKEVNKLWHSIKRLFTR